MDKLRKRDGWTVVPCKRKEALSYTKKHHFRKSLPAAIWAYKLVDKKAQIQGMAVFSTPSSPSVYKIFQGCDYDEVFQLCRLILPKCAVKNAGSYLLKRAIALFKAEVPEAYIVVTYCELRKGHEGAVFRASNWEFYGISSGGKEALVGKYRVQVRGSTRGEYTKIVKRKPKARYFYFT